MTGKKQKSTFARNIVSRRAALGLSGKAFAELAKIPYPTLRDIEAGVSSGNPRTRAAIATALGCTIDDMHRPPQSPGIEELAAVIARQKVEIERLKSLYEKIPIEVLEKLIEVYPSRSGAIRAALGLVSTEPSSKKGAS